MLAFGTFAFTAPWALLGLLALPVIWWLLRLTPPAPTRIAFPPFRLLLGLVTREESSAKTPPWLILLRLAIAALLVLAAAGPLINQAAQWQGSGPLVLVVDNGWPAAKNWPDRQRLLTRLTDQAARDGRPVTIVTTAPPPSGAAADQVHAFAPRQAQDFAQALQPRPWPSNRTRALELMTRSALAQDRGAQVVWLSDGLDHGSADAFAEGLVEYGPLTVVTDGPGTAAPKILRPPVLDGGVILARVERADSRAEETVFLRAYAADGRLVAREEVLFNAGESAAEIRLDLPAEMANRLARLDLEDVGSAAAVILLDERWRRRPVGIATGAGGAELPLLSSIFYLSRALEPFSEIRQGTIAGLLRRQLALMILPDPGTVAGPDRTAIKGWMEDGGVAVRFAGPLLAQATSGQAARDGDAPLVPVPLRRGDRVIGGAMSWSKPAKLAPFDAESPFHGLSVPDDVTVTRQVLAQPSLDLERRTWARLDDGTPLVTAERRGKGWLVLFHTTANTQWSNLALSGLMVEMLQRLVGLSQGVVDTGQGPPLEPIQTLDAFGTLGDAPPDTAPIAQNKFAETSVSPQHPPGLYGRDNDRRALNLGRDAAVPRPLGALSVAARQETYGGNPAIDVRPWLLILAVLMALADFAISLWLRGLLRVPRMAAPLLAFALVGAAGTAVAQEINVPTRNAPTAQAASPDAYALENSTQTRLAYVITGDAETDRISRLGLSGLSLIVRRRTAAELSDPQGVDLDRDDLAFFPLMYWPVVSGASNMSEAARIKVNAYMQNGGTILFDTRDRAGATDLGELRALARKLDIPPLVVAPPNHVLTRAFYLLQDFPGRWTGSALWVERAGARVNDGVSPVIAGGNDWAAAWALDENTQQALFPAVPGGERQRELAYRFGVNLVMYVLTGNYKADQVHLPAIIRRLGQ
ncbi:MAG: hypothetical protein COW30_16515 [Rhodospirillales bacterium CG15_BIG_FIL_POST_REV_8_21_14_020_66_15]|nr:MAG: hypothetical protein COW30_16515 [Rhodospirillales bacterium CG15_BIG_FIL_POST_REV_8_21_14_020_66_15]